MKLSTGVLKKIAERNLEMLFAKDTFQITFQTKSDDEKGSIRIMRIEPTHSDDPTIVSWCWIEFEIQEWKRLPSYTYLPVRAVQMMTHFFNDSYLDIAKCVKCIVDKINEISALKRMPFYIDEECIVLGFSEIGIDYPNGKRDIIVNRNGMYSMITFNDDEPITTAITIDDVRNTIYSLEDPVIDAKLEFIGSDIIPFVDYDVYCDDID